MKAVMRLVWQYFMGTPMNRGFTLIGLAIQAVAFYVLTTQAQSGEMLWVATFGLMALFIGSSLMPLTVGRLARSHVVAIVPHGRLKLLLSAFITVFLVAAPVAVLTPFAFVAGMAGSPTDLLKYQQLLDDSIQLAKLMFTSAFLFAGWMYLALWFVTSQRNFAGFFKGLLVVMLVLFAPAREIRDFGVSLSWNLQQIAIIWILFGAAFLLWPRIVAALARYPMRFGRFNRETTSSISGSEFDLMLGTASPWRLIAVLALPVILATRFVDDVPSVWLFFLTLFSTVAGAIAGEAAARSRALWLRGDWTRETLFSRVEQCFWRHNGYVLGCLLLLMVGIGSYAGLPTTMLAAGLPLLILGTVLSTYLGLMITRGVQWPEIVLGVAVMLALMAVAVLIVGESVNLGVVIVIEITLAAGALLLRRAAIQRWKEIDWIRCRPDKVLSTRAAR
jgi:MFS family permease